MGDSVTFVFTAGQTTGTFIGRVASPNIIEGSYSQGGPTLPFYAKRSGELKDVASAENESNIVIELEDVQVGGTLTMPDELKSPYLVIMSSGSGPQDRDETLFGFKVFDVIAQHLASQGIASFRYDDRGINESSGDFVNSTIDDLSSDVEGIMNYFTESDEYDFNEFTLFGHSQGGLIAGKVAASNDKVKQVILMASPTALLADVVIYQSLLSYEPYNLDSVLVFNEVEARDELMRALYKNEGADSALQKYKSAYAALLNSLPDGSKPGPDDFEQAVDNQAELLRINYGLPSLSSFLYYDPTQDLSKLDIPVLALYGGKDTQVTTTQNQGLMEVALFKLGDKKEVVVFDDANHLFQKANSGLVNEYGNLEKAFVDGFLDKISEWILSN
jgi:hypothetical protein